MEEKDKQIVVISDAKPVRKWRHNKRFRVLFTSILLVVLLTVCVLLVANKKSGRSDSQSQKLTTNITHLQKTSSCDAGLKQIEPKATAIESSKSYTLAARETGLNYLMNCNFVQRNPNKALNYADALNSLYVQSKNTQAQAQLAQFVNYIKNYGH
jgi:hypothetical protein